MPIKIGSKIPSLLLVNCVGGKLKSINTEGVFSSKNIVMFGLPGAFTPTCSTEHLPGYMKMLGEFNELGIEVICTSVNDPFVMKAWAKSLGVNGITMLADGNCALTKAMGLDADLSSFGMGIRCKRYALYAEDRVIKILAVEKPGMFEVSRAEAMLEAVKNFRTSAKN